MSADDVWYVLKAKDGNWTYVHQMGDFEEVEPPNIGQFQTWEDAYVAAEDDEPTEYGIRVFRGNRMEYDQQTVLQLVQELTEVADRLAKICQRLREEA